MALGVSGFASSCAVEDSMGKPRNGWQPQAATKGIGVGSASALPSSSATAATMHPRTSWRTGRTRAKKCESLCGSVIFEPTPGELDEAIDLMVYEFGVLPMSFQPVSWRWNSSRSARQCPSGTSTNWWTQALPGATLGAGMSSTQRVRACAFVLRQTQEACLARRFCRNLCGSQDPGARAEPFCGEHMRGLDASNGSPPSSLCASSSVCTSVTRLSLAPSPPRSPVHSRGSSTSCWCSSSGRRRRSPTKMAWLPSRSSQAQCLQSCPRPPWSHQEDEKYIQWAAAFVDLASNATCDAVRVLKKMSDTLHGLRLRRGGERGKRRRAEGRLCKRRDQIQHVKLHMSHKAVDNIKKKTLDWARRWSSGRLHDKREGNRVVMKGQ